MSAGRSWRFVLGLLLRVVLAGLFVVAGVLKLLDPAQFALEIANYQMWPALAPVIATILPAVEIVVGAALVVLPVPWRQAAGAIATALTSVFLVAVGSAYFRGVNIECGCFGGEGSPIDGGTLLRNGALLLMSVGILVLDRPGGPRGA